MLFRFVLPSALLVSVSLYQPAAAHACSGPTECGASFSLPYRGAEVPANLPGIELYLRETAQDVVYTLRTTGESPVDLRTTKVGELITFDPLEAAREYQLAASWTCEYLDDLSLEATFTTTEAAPLPTTLGSLSAGEPTLGDVDLPADDAACALPVAASYVDVEVDLSDEATPWVEALYFETLVDGRVWRPTGHIFGDGEVPPWESWFGRGRDRVYVQCGSTPHGAYAESDLAEGEHTIEMRARVAGTDEFLSAGEVTVNLTCGENPGNPDGGVDDGSTTSGEGDTSCSVGGSSSPTSAMGFVIALALVGRLRRRR